MAWTIRVAIDTTVLLIAGRWMLGGKLLPGRGGVWAALIMLAAVSAGWFPNSLAVRVVYSVVVLGTFWIIGARSLLPVNERVALRGWLRREHSRSMPASESVA